MSNLTKLEHSELQKCEEIIERGLSSFVDVGNALLRIRDGKLYRETHATFEAYCKIWGLSRPYAYQIMEAAKTTKNLSAIADTSTLHEGILRPLAGFSPPRIISGGVSLEAFLRKASQ